MRDEMLDESAVCGSPARRGGRRLGRWVGPLALVLAAGATGGAELWADELVDALPEIVARVDGTPITREELLGQAEFVARQLGPELAVDRDFFVTVLGELVAGELLAREAERLGYAPSAEEVQRAVDQGKEGFVSDEVFREELARRGQTEAELASVVRENLAVSRLVEAEIEPGVQVTEEEVRRHFETDVERLRTPERVLVSLIFVAASPEGGAVERDAARRRTEALRDRIAAGEAFAAVAKEASEDERTREEGGRMPWLAKGDGSNPVEAAAFALGVGELSPVVESPFGFHLLYKHDHEPAFEPSYEEMRSNLAGNLRQRLVQQRLKRRVEGLREEATIEVYF